VCSSDGDYVRFGPPCADFDLRYRARRSCLRGPQSTRLERHLASAGVISVSPESRLRTRAEMLKALSVITTAYRANGPMSPRIDRDTLAFAEACKLIIRDGRYIEMHSEIGQDTCE